MRWMQQLIANRTGNALVTALIAAGIITGVGTIMMNRATASVRQMQQSAEADQAWYLAMAGIEECIGELRWDANAWTSFHNSPITCTGSLSGGTYRARASKVSTMTGSIISEGTYGRFSRKLVATIQWENKTGAPGSMSLYGGGNWRFSGNSNIEGNIATMGSMIFAGSSVLCGNAHAAETITLEGNPPEAHLKSGCNSTITEKSTVVVAYSDDWDGPYDIVKSGNYTLDKNTDGKANAGWSYMFVDGVLTVPVQGINFERTVKIVASKGFVVNGSVSAADGFWVYLYSMAPYGGTEPCQDVQGTAQANQVGTTLTGWVDQSLHKDVVFWMPNGMIYFKGSQSGGPNSEVAGIYGKVFGKCVQTADNWNYFPGADRPGGTCQVGCASTLRLGSIYECKGGVNNPTCGVNP